MNQPTLRILVGVALIWTTFTAHSASAADPDAPRETLSLAFREAVVSAPGKTITAMIVDYPPGGKSLSHRHGAAFVIGYVLAGAIRSQIDDGQARVYRAGEHWTEKPGVHHKISENASATEPAKLLAIFVASTKNENLVKWDKK